MRGEDAKVDILIKFLVDKLIQAFQEFSDDLLLGQSCIIKVIENVNQEDVSQLVCKHFLDVFFQSLQDTLPVLGIEHGEASTGNIEALVRGKQRWQLLLQEVIHVLDSLNV